MNQELKYSLILLSLIVSLLAPTVFATSNIDSDYKYAWSSTTGWLNFQPSHGGVTIYPDHLEGDAWSEQSGWIQLGSYSGGGSYHYENTSSTNWGVNQDDAGQLSGYAWSDTLGWVNFNPSHSQVIIDQESGDFQGSAWSEVGGWIQFKQDEAPTYKVRYNPNNSTETSTTVSTTEKSTVAEPLLPPTISGEVTGTSNMKWQTITDEVTIEKNTSISNVIFEKDVKNEGLVSNFKVAQGATFEGGKITGYIINEGTIADVEFVGAELRGGILSGTIINSGQGIIKDVQLAPNTTIKGGKVGGTITCDSSSTLHDVQLTAGTIFSGCQLSGDISSDPDQPTQLDDTNQIAPGTKLSYVLLKPTVELPNDVELGPGVTLLIKPDELTAEKVAQISPPLFAAIQAEQLAKFSKDTVSGITPEQLAYLSLKSLGGLTRNNMGGLSIAVLHEMTPEQVTALNKAEFKQMPSQDVSKLFVNFDKDKISPQDVEEMVPPGWKLDLETGALTAPVGAKLTLKTLPIDSQFVTSSEAIDLDKGFGLGGSGTPLKEGLKESLKGSLSGQGNNLDIEISQAPDSGITTVKIAGLGDSEIQYSFMLDKDDVNQVDAGNKSVNLPVDEGGFYQITTPTGQQVTVIPAPQDPVALSEAIGGGEVVVGERGDVLMIDAIDSGTVAIFDGEIKKTTSDTQNVPKGMYKTEDDKNGYVVYEDGSTQVIRSTFLQPDNFEERVKNEYGIYNFIFHKDGTFSGSVNGENYVVEPNFKVDIIEIKKGELVEEGIKLNGNILTYTIVTNAQWQPNIRRRQTRNGSSTNATTGYGNVNTACSNCKSTCNSAICNLLIFSKKDCQKIKEDCIKKCRCP